MKHLTDEQVYALATKISANSSFTSDEITNMHHISQCDACYQMLCCVMAMQDVSLRLGEFAHAPSASAAKVPTQTSFSAIIRLAASTVKPLLEQVEANIATWSFDTPLAVAGARSSRSDHQVCKLEDIDNSKTFVAYDPERKLLVFQVECGEEADIPIVEIRYPDGKKQQVVMQKVGGVFWAEVHELEDGDYQILLKK